MIGRVVDALGQPIDGKGPIETKQFNADRAHRARRGRPPAGERAAADRHQGHRRDDSDRPRPARADHRRPPDRQDHGRDRHHHQSEGRRRDLHLRRDRAEALDGGAGGEDAGRLRRHGVHDRGGGHGVRSRADAVPGAVLGLRDRRIFPRQQAARAVHLRRSFEARRRVSRDFAAAAPSSRARGVSRRRVLSPQPLAGARGEAHRTNRAADR